LLWQKNATDAKTCIDMSEFSKGIYFIKVQNDEHIQTGKFVIE
jgi:hypothetical protein